MIDEKMTPPSELRKFGIAFTVFLFILGTLILWRQEWLLGKVTGSMYCMAALFLITALVTPRTLQPVFRRWMVFARALGWFNTKILLILIYYLLFAPTSLVISLFGGDMLNRKIRNNEASFWIDKEDKEQSIERYGKQF